MLATTLLLNAVVLIKFLFYSNHHLQHFFIEMLLYPIPAELTHILSLYRFMMAIMNLSYSPCVYTVTNTFLQGALYNKDVELKVCTWCDLCRTLATTPDHDVSTTLKLENGPEAFLHQEEQWRIVIIDNTLYICTGAKTAYAVHPLFQLERDKLFPASGSRGCSNFTTGLYNTIGFPKLNKTTTFGHNRSYIECNCNHFLQQCATS